MRVKCVFVRALRACLSVHYMRVCLCVMCVFVCALRACLCVRYVRVCVVGQQCSESPKFNFK